MKYSRLLVIFLTLYLVALVATAYGVGFNENVDAWSILLVGLWVVTVQVALLTMAGGTGGRFVLWLTTYVSIFFWIPFFGYLAVPSMFPKWRPTLQHGAATMNLALSFMLIGTAVILIGYLVGAAIGQPFGRRLERRYSARSQRPHRLYLSPSWFFVCAMLFLAFDAYVTLRFAIYFVGSDAAGEGTWWRRFLSFSLFSLVGPVYLLERWRELDPPGRMLIGVPVVLNYFLRVVTGSRSTIFYAGLFILQYFLVKQGDFRMRGRLLGGLVALSLTAVLFFPIASSARFFWSKAFTSGFTTDDARASLSDAVAEWQDPATYLEPFARLDLFVVVLLVVDGPASELVDPAPHLGPVHDAKAFVNIIMPGEPFPGVLESSLTFSVVYLGISADYFTDFNRNLTVSWTMWGLAYAWGGFAGGLMLLLFWSSSCTFLYRVLVACGAGAFQTFFAVWVFTKSATQLDTFGFDLSVAYVVYDLMAFVPAALLLWLGARLRPMPRSLPITSLPSSTRPPASGGFVPNPVRR